LPQKSFNILVSSIFQTKYTEDKLIKVKFSLEQATKAQRGSKGIALPFL
jgi:hypothetical protein